MEVQETKIADEIYSVYSSPFNRENIYDMTKEDVQITIDEEALKYLLVKDKGNVLGVFCIHSTEPKVCIAHINMLPEGRGLNAYRAGVLFEDWLRQNSDYKRIQVVIPKEATQAYNYVVNCGFKKDMSNESILSKEIV